MFDVEKILVMTDSGADLTAEEAKKYSIEVIPFTYSFDGENYYRDGVDKTTEEFYEIERASKDVPKTAQISPVQFEEIYGRAYNDGYTHLILTLLSGTGSGTFQNASMMAESFMEEHPDFHIELIDSQSYTVVYGYAVVEGAKAVLEGKTAAEAADRIRHVLEGSGVRFIVGDLNHLKRGGRINAATLVVANMLDIKPVLTIKGGLVVQDGMIRGSKNLYKKFVADVEKHADFENGTIVVINTCIPDKAEELKNTILEKYPGINVKVSLVGSTIGCHCGPDLVAIVYFKDKFEV